MSYLHDPNGIYSTLPTYSVEMTGEGFSLNYDYLQGTSMATPYVSGLAALIWSVAPGLMPAQVQQVIQNTAVDRGPAGWDQDYGYGRIAPLAALQSVALPAPTLSPISNPEHDGAYSVSWSAVSGATGYTLQEDDNASFSSPATRYSGAATQTAISGQAVGTWYYRVRATAGGFQSDWSNVVSTQVLPQPPVLATITNSTHEDAYLVNWRDVGGASGYTLQEDDNARFSSPPTRYSAAPPPYSAELANTSAFSSVPPWAPPPRRGRLLPPSPPLPTWRSWGLAPQRPLLRPGRLWILWRPWGLSVPWPAWRVWPPLPLVRWLPAWRPVWLPFPARAWMAFLQT